MICRSCGRSCQLYGYRRLLARFYGFYTPAETSLCGVTNLQSALTDWPKRRKIEWLVKDLSALGFTGQQVADLPLCSHLPALPGTAEALGCLYVLEGSTLGGQIIGRHLRATLQLEPDNGASFLRAMENRPDSCGRHFKGRCCQLPRKRTTGLSMRRSKPSSVCMNG